MIAWSIFAVGGVYVWAGAPLLAGAVVLAVAVRPRVAGSRETRTLDIALLLGLLPSLSSSCRFPVRRVRGSRPTVTVFGLLSSVLATAGNRFNQFL